MFDLLKMSLETQFSFLDTVGEVKEILAKSIKSNFEKDKVYVRKHWDL